MDGTQINESIGKGPLYLQTVMPSLVPRPTPQQRMDRGQWKFMQLR